ncbi:hypothetical protein GCM10010271_54210 [Streptomyces kurssanovii]|nr:hypothetical protein GCM10010271_54210 [Streptomyces kurssanovii]
MTQAARHKGPDRVGGPGPCDGGFIPARTTMANDVRRRRKDMCPLRPEWLMHSMSTAAGSSEGVAVQSAACPAVGGGVVRPDLPAVGMPNA